MSSPEIHAFIIALHNQKDRNLEDIRLVLLAALDEHHGFPEVKKLFEEAIKGVHVP
jgi:hypothetical protein